MKKNVQHSIYFSGRGFHIFIMVNQIMSLQLKNSSMAIKNCHKYLIEETNIKPDPVTVDLMRIARLPNTKNMKTGLFCIPITSEELYFDLDDIYNLAKCQRNISSKQENENKINLNYFDGKKVEIDYVETIDSGIELDINDNNIPECVKNNLLYGNCNYQQRYAIITALRDLSYSKKEVKRILKKYLTSKKYNHCINEEKQLDYLFRRQDLLFPSCETLKSQGQCVNGNKKCKGQHIYF
jgi:DNA primase catalytic subunit